MATSANMTGLAKRAPSARVSAVEAGLPVKMVRVLMRDYGFNITDLTHILASRRTLERRLAEGERLNVDESERLMRLLRLLDLAMEVFEDRERARRWLAQPHWTLDERSPLELMRTEDGGRMVEDELLRLKWGHFA